MSFTATKIAVETFGIAIILIFIVREHVRKNRNPRLHKLFLRLLYIRLAVALFDIAARLWEGRPGDIPHAITALSFFSMYLLAAPDMIALLAYVAEGISLGAPSRRRLFLIAAPLAGIYTCLLAISQVNGMFYSIGGDNVFQKGPLYWLPYCFVILFFLETLIVLLCSRKKLGAFATLAFSSYTLLMTMALVFIMNTYDMEFVFAAMAVSLLIVFINTQAQHENHINEQELALLEQQTAIMLSQIQPHFLYNSLGAIGDLCYLDADKAHEAVVTFSGYLRMNMDSLSQKTPIPFEKELEHTRQYLWLEQLRFEERLQVEYDIRATSFLLPVLTLQPLVENAVRYGVIQKRAGGRIRIRTREDDDAYRITVEDNGAGFDPGELRTDERSHTGIANVRARLAALCGGRLEIESTPGVGTTAVILLPKGTEGS